MAQPTPYTITRDFSDWQTANPGDVYLGTDFDVEFLAIKATLDDVLANLSLIQRDDGEIRDQMVGRDQLAPNVAAGIDTPTAWATSTAYTVLQSVIQDNKWYWCSEAHTSGTFATDYSSGYWELIIDFAAAFSAAYQPLDATLTALAAVTTAANKIVYATGSDTFSTTDFTAAARTLLADASASAMLTTLGALPIAGGTMTGDLVLAGAPDSNLKAATKLYVDTAVAGIQNRLRVRCASTANVVIASELENGDSIDGVTLATGDFVLLRAQTATEENGVYTVPASGAASRSDQYNTWDELYGTMVIASEGSTLAGYAYLNTSDAGGTLGVTAIAYSQFAPGSGGTVTNVATSGLASGGPITTTGTVAVTVASQAEAEAGSLNTVAMTPLRTAQAIAAISGTDQTARDIAMQNAWNILELQGAAVYGLGPMVVDAFETADGIDAATSTNETYDATNDLYYNPATAGSAISGASGTNIGDATAAGGLAGANDGTTNQAAASCAGKTSATETYAGKTLAAATKIFKATIHGANNAGYVNGINPTVTATMYGKTGAAPGSATDGTVIGTLSFTDTGDESAGRDITSTDFLTSWDHAWVRFSHDGAASDMWIAELIFTEASSVPNMTLVSDPMVAASAPSTLRIAAEIDAQDSPVIGTDFKMYGSRDSGATWTEVASYTDHVSSGNVKIIKGTATVSGQPAGTNVRIKVETLNNQYIPVHEWGVMADVELTPPA